jgi:hypothetical protein
MPDVQHGQRDGWWTLNITQNKFPENLCSHGRGWYTLSPFLVTRPDERRHENQARELITEPFVVLIQRYPMSSKRCFETAPLAGSRAYW